MRVGLVTTHRSDRAHYAPLRRVLEADERFELVGAPDISGDPDIAVVLGDREEMLRWAIWYVEARVPLLHIHGGEHTIGALDERYRWAMTMLADVHCVATEQAQWEVDKHILGDAKPGFTDAYRRLSLKTFVTGAPGLDDIHERQPVQGELALLVHYNPAMTRATTRREWLAIVQAIAALDDMALLTIKPNGDRFSEDIIQPDNAHELDSERYRDVLAAAKVIVGNSSAGIIEAPSLGTWAVNVGDRQKRREQAGNVIDVPADPEKIRAAVQDALSRPRFDGPNPYAHPQGKASEAIRDVLLGMA